MCASPRPRRLLVAASPDYEVLTEDRRRDARLRMVRSANSLAFLVGVLVSGDYERLAGAVNDYIHQPFRGKLNPCGAESNVAGCHAGAYSGWLSGSGSTVICVTPPDCALAVGEAMQQAYAVNGTQARVYRLQVDNGGLQVL